MVHLAYIIILCIFVEHNYIYTESDKAERVHLYIMAATILYPFFYESYQLVAAGPVEYFKDTSNYKNICFIVFAIANILFQEFYGTNGIGSKWMMTFMIIFSIQRTMEYLRIQEQFSPIVTMMFNVLYEMGDFLIFLFIVCLFLSVLPAILQFGNPNKDGSTQGTY